MAGFKSSFEGNVDYAYGRGTRDITSSLERGISSLSSGGAIAQLSRQASSARGKIKDLNSEISALKQAQEAADDPSVWFRLQKNIDASRRGVEQLRKELKQMPFDALERGLGRVTKGLVAFNSALLTIGLDFLVESIKRVYELQERWTKAIGGFNMRIGGMTAGLRGATKAAVAWSSTIRGLTNGDINEGIQMFGEFTDAIGRTVEKGDQFEKFGLQLSRGFNIGGSGAGQLTKVLENIGDTGDDAAGVMKDLVKGANAARVPTNLLAKDVLESSTYLARFGKEGQKTFVTGAAWARKYTITINQLKGAVEGLDMFDEAAKTASKLNTAFGTMINSMDLMLEDDPAKRLEMIRQQFLAQGTTFDRLTPKQRRYLSETLKLTEDQVAALLSSKNANQSYADFQAKAARKEKDELTAKQMMEKQLRATTQTMYAFGMAFDRITVAIANSIKPLLKVLGLAGQGDKDFKSFGQVMESITVTVEDFFRSLAKNEKWQSWIQRLAIDLRAAGGALSDWVTSGDAAKFVGDLAAGMKRFYIIVRDLVTFAVPKFRTLIEVLLEVSKHLGLIAAAWIGLKAFNGLGGINGFAGKGIGGIAKAVGGGSLGRGAGRLGMAGAAAGIGGAIGGASTGIGAGLGSLVGSAFGPIGMVLGPIIGGLAGKAVEWIFGSSKIKTELDRAHEDLEKSIESETRKREGFSAILDIARASQEAQDRTRQASNGILRAMDAAAAKAQGKAIELTNDEAIALRARADELGLFGKSARENRRLLDGLGAGSKLTKQQLDSLLQGASAYEDELSKLRDTTKQQADLELSRLQVSGIGQQKEALELTTKLREQELKRAREDFMAGGGSAVNRVAVSAYGTGSFGNQNRYGDTAQSLLEKSARKQLILTDDEQRQLALEVKIDKLDLDNTKEQKRLLGLQTDFLRQQTIIELKRAVMSDSNFLEFQRTKEEQGKTLDSQLVDFVNSGRSSLGSDPYALSLLKEGSSFQTISGGTRAESTPLPMKSYVGSSPVLPEFNFAPPAQQSTSSTSTNINVVLSVDGKQLAGAIVKDAVRGRH